MTDKVFPEQIDANFECSEMPGIGYSGPTTAALGVTHMLARSNAMSVDDFDCIVICLNRETGKSFISSTLSPITTQLVLLELSTRKLPRDRITYKEDRNPDASA